MSNCEEENRTNMNGAISCSSCLIFFAILLGLNLKSEGFGVLSMILLIPVLSSLAAILTNLFSFQNCDTKKDKAPASK
jgi:hypothetical protein